MVRPCFVVLDQEFPGNISTRKLVVETAKLNVITAYSGAETIATLKLFPAVTGVVLDARVRDIPCSDLSAALRQMQPRLLIIVVGSPKGAVCEADHHLAQFEPRQLLRLIEPLRPEAAELARRENQPGG